MTYFCCSIIVSVVLFILIWKWIYDRQTRKRLYANQNEWNKIKQNLEENGATVLEISDKYSEYIQYLWDTRDSVYGACFPRK